MIETRLNEIAAFVEVGRRLSFVRAAEQLGVHVSAVSRAINALEGRLGVRLLQRTTRRVGLTEAGRAHFLRCEAVLAELQEAESAASALGGALRGTLRVSAGSGLGLTHMTPVLARFLERHPQLDLDLHLSNRNVDLVEEGFDLAIRIGALSDSRLVARRLGDSRRLLVASPAYLDAQGTPRRPADLATHAALVLEVGTMTARWALQRRGANATVRVRPRLRSNNALALLDACRAGVGIALLPQFIVGADLDAQRLVRVLPAWAAAEQGIFAIYPGNRFIPAKVRAFVDFVEEILQPAAAVNRERRSRTR
ncbi:LysR family transcriptional regulator [Dokdonella sp.]|uniref:LysR family transcriptional regulator n=1 Tax=Dokdonella sp. TaxID=2291710 RepID=UPI001B082B3F|nr:LysR family transcriptional regulator [Dokdonella sp.]MBO9664862.1 LysR family transcriptional regulator [Dokdonella sp.]